MVRTPAEVYPLAQFLVEEMQARGWTTDDVGLRMDVNDTAIGATRGALAVATLLSASNDNLLVDDNTFEGLSRAFEVSETYFRRIDDQWRRNPDRRAAFNAPDDLFGPITRAALACALGTPKKRTIYLSGPISGMPEKNHPLFMSVAGQLRAEGHEVYNPREFCWTEGTFPKRKAFAAYCDFICNKADTIVLLPGWQQSKGATTERGLAENCGLDIIEWTAWHAPMLDDVGSGP